MILKVIKFYCKYGIKTVFVKIWAEFRNKFEYLIMESLSKILNI